MVGPALRLPVCAEFLRAPVLQARIRESDRRRSATGLARERNLLELSVWSTYCANEPEERQARVGGRRPRRARHLRRRHQMVSDT